MCAANGDCFYKTNVRAALVTKNLASALLLESHLAPVYERTRKLCLHFLTELHKQTRVKSMHFNHILQSIKFKWHLQAGLHFCRYDTVQELYLEATSVAQGVKSECCPAAVAASPAHSLTQSAQFHCPQHQYTHQPGLPVW